MPKRLIFVVLPMLLVILAACGSPEPEPTKIAQLVPTQEPTAVPTDMPALPTDTPAPDAEPTADTEATAVPEATATSEPTATTEAEALSPLPTPTEELPPTPTPEPEPEDWSEAESRPYEGQYELGNMDSTFVIQDYSDFLWGACQAHVLRKEPTLIEEYVKPGTVKLQFRHILDHGNDSLQASAAAECAGEQGRFWKMHDLLFENHNSLRGANGAYFDELAASLDMDVEWFQECMEEGKMHERVQLADQEAKALGVRVRPTFIITIDGEEVQRLQGSPTLEQWRQTLDDLS